MDTMYMYTQPEVYSTNSDWQKRFHNIGNTVTSSFEVKKSSSIRVLDMGCGTGCSTKNFLLKEHPSVKEIVGIDISKDMIEHAQLSNADDKIKYVVADIQDESTFDSSWFESFDAVYSSNVFHWLPQQVLALKNVRSLLVKNGECHLKFISFVSEYLIEASERLLKRWASYIPNNYEMPCHFNRKWNSSPWVSVKEPAQCYAEFMENIGFHVKSSSFIPFGRTFDKELFMSTFKGFYPPLVFIPEEQHEAFLEDLLKIVDELGALDDLEATAGNTSLSVHATKI